MSGQYPSLGPLVAIDVLPRDPDADYTGVYHAYLTDEIDTWGKRTVRVLRLDGDLETWYLFEDEYIVVLIVLDWMTKP